MSDFDFERARKRMVSEQLVKRGLSDLRVLAAMRLVPRELFVPAELHERAYDDEPLPIGNHQTISQPYMVGLMSETLGLREGQKVLEVGTGSGYQAAVLAAMGAEVVSIERLPQLATRAQAALEAAGLAERVTIEVGDGTLGWEACAPYDAIVVTAGAPQIPRPLVSQLTPEGCLVLPIGEEELQTLVRLRRGPDGLAEEYMGECRFVKLHGTYGWEEP
ncbi:MAG TPA: protein-L-isoaspartate(D-aspartate) O-methyltransferase [Candidatus Binatia bacterium]|nr:protein-L-isoaspartate(D-aspartate) O-methyltransferase [Candidatus Binatia bacterium]